MILVYGRYLYWTNIVPVRNGAGTMAGPAGRHRCQPEVHHRCQLAGRRDRRGGYLYWTNNATGTIGRARLDGTDVNQKFIKTAQPNGPDAVVALRHLYWANDFTIGRANLNGTGVNQKFIAVPNGPSGVAGLAVNARYIYWTNEKGNEIGRANLNGTGVNQRFITGASFPNAIATGSRYLYWTNQNSRAIGRARLNGTDVNQRFVAKKDFRNLHGVAVNPGR